LSRFDLKAGIELGQVSGQHLVGTLQIGSAGFAQFFDQPVLEGTPQPFDASFGLWVPRFAGEAAISWMPKSSTRRPNWVRGNSPYSSCSTLG
jgi:hypothetical protein